MLNIVAFVLFLWIYPNEQLLYNVLTDLSQECKERAIIKTIPWDGKLREIYTIVQLHKGYAALEPGQEKFVETSVGPIVIGKPPDPKFRHSPYWRRRRPPKLPYNWATFKHIQKGKPVYDLSFEPENSPCYEKMILILEKKRVR